MNIQKLLQRCRDRRFNRLTQVRTQMYETAGFVNHTAIPHIHYAHKKTAPATAFTESGISIIPIRQDRIGADGTLSTGPVCKFTDALNAKVEGWDAWKTTFTFEHWEEKFWRHSYGVQAFTGYPSNYWTDLDFEWESIERHPHETAVCIAALLQLTDTPLLTISKSGGIRFSCRTPGYIHPRDDENRIYVAEWSKHLDAHGNPVRDHIFLEIFGEKGVSRWDARYEIVSGTLMNPPVIKPADLFKVVRGFKSQVHTPPPLQTRRKTKKRKSQAKQGVANSQQRIHKWTMDNLPADLSWIQNRAGSLKSRRGNYQCTMNPHPKSGGRNLQFFMERNGTVRIWCHNCRQGTTLGRYGASQGSTVDDLIANAPDYEEIPTAEQQHEWKLQRIRNFDASPLEIQRPAQILFKSDKNDAYTTLEENDAKIRAAFDEDKRAVVLNSETGAGKNYQAENAILDGARIVKTTPTVPLAIADKTRMTERGIVAFLWKPRNWMAEAQRKREPEDLFTDPFKDGAVCIYPDRCDALFMRGGRPRKTICPNCEVYDMCKSDGYISQHDDAIASEAIIISMPDMFFNPNRQGFTNDLLLTFSFEDGELVEEKYGRFGLIDEAKAHEFYMRCVLSRDQLKAWRDMWGEERMLGMFAIDMLYLLEAEGFEIASIRKYINALDAQIDDTVEIINHQMRRVLHAGEVFRRGYKNLAHFSIRFENGVEVYIAATDRAYIQLLKAGELCVAPRAYKKKDMIGLTIEQAIRFELYSDQTVKDILCIPWVAGSWTPLDQLISFFKHYVVDANTPMFYDSEKLTWFSKPVMHPSLQKLVMMSATLNLEHTKKSLLVKEPKEHDMTKDDIAFVRTPPTEWKPGSKVFQIRTGIYPRKSLMTYEDNKPEGLNARGQAFFDFIENNIKADPEQNHAVITFQHIYEWIGEDWKAKYPNLPFFGYFQKMEGLDDIFKDIKNYWIVGSPEVGANVIKHTAKLLYGDKAEPLNFERDDERNFIDADVQSVYEACVVALLQQAVGRARLNRIAGNRVFIFSGVHIPTVTDREETMLFDFADCEIATHIDKLERWIRIREEDEIDMDDIEDEIADALWRGESGYSLVREGHPKHLVQKIQKEMKKEIVDKQAKEQENNRRKAKAMRENGNSFAEISKSIGISEYKVKQLLKNF